MTWEEMQDKFPDQWIGVMDAEMDGANVRSGIVEYIGKSMGELNAIQSERDNFISVYTGADSFVPRGAVEYFGSIKNLSDGLELQRSMRDEWD